MIAATRGTSQTQLLWQSLTVLRRVAGFEGGDTEGAASVRCLRQQDAGRQRHELMAYFGEACADDFDLPSFQDTAYIKARRSMNEIEFEQFLI